ncbi:MAG: thioredoxin-dependent thiol peroxidase [Deltaproteobacteria bacterium]|nr:thioredoxin-dependent thiol peroxidase [Deltaproteobacteria bacterium]
MALKLPKIGDKAPTFRLKNQDGKEVDLSKFREKNNVVLYFYPKAMTPGCTTQACSVRDYKKEFEKLGIVVLGVSADSQKLIKKFQETYELNFDLLSDEGHKVAEEYGVWGEKSVMGRLVQGLNRVTFIIAKDGTIAHVIPKVNAQTHHEDVLKFFAQSKPSS